MDIYQVEGDVDIFPQKGGWVYIRVPIEITERLIHMAKRGLIPIRITVGNTTWDTSLLPMGDGTHFIPLNAKVRKRENIEADDHIKLSFQVRD